jgi:DNA-binding transcriptional LysR family regulator
MVRAARKLQLAQPALSQAIGRLESQLGVKLLDRHPRGVAVTPAGQAFLEKARATLDAADAVDATARSWARAQAGRLLVGFLSLAPPMSAKELFDRFSGAHPEITLQWRELGYPTPDARAWLGDADAALVWHAPPGPGLASQPVRTSRLVAAVSERHPLADRSELTVAEVIDETFPGIVSWADPAWLGFWGLDRFRGGPSTRTTDTAETPQEVATMIARGIAVTTVPETVAIPFVHLGIRAIPLIDTEPVELALVWPPDASNPLVEELVAIAKGIWERGDQAR